MLIGPGRHSIQWLFFSPNLCPDLFAIPRAIGHSFLHGNLFPWIPWPSIRSSSHGGRIVHNTMAPGRWGEWRVKSGLLCSPGCIPWPRLCLLRGRGAFSYLGQRHCQVGVIFTASFIFPPTPFLALSQASHPRPVLECPLGTHPGPSIYPPWVIFTIALALRTLCVVDSRSGLLPGASDISFQFPGRYLQLRCSISTSNLASHKLNLVSFSQINPHLLFPISVNGTTMYWFLQARCTWVWALALGYLFRFIAHPCHVHWASYMRPHVVLWACSVHTAPSAGDTLSTLDNLENFYSFFNSWPKYFPVKLSRNPGRRRRSSHISNALHMLLPWCLCG